MKGNYILVLQLDADLEHVEIGRLGRFDLPAGYYLYVGSAFGPGGLDARLAYHQRREKAHPHWHIDYLRAYCRLHEAWIAVGSVRMEVYWCMALADIPRLKIPVPGFGASDTRCRSHLFYSPQRPDTHFLTNVLLGCLPLQGQGKYEMLIEVRLFDDA